MDKMFAVEATSSERDPDPGNKVERDQLWSLRPYTQHVHAHSHVQSPPKYTHTHYIHIRKKKNTFLKCIGRDRHQDIRNRVFSLEYRNLFCSASFISFNIQATKRSQEFFLLI